MLGIVAIGRNEGVRLQHCLESLQDFAGPIIYVDSDSSDDSVTLAQNMGIAVHQLDPSKPMSAARARREGFRELAETHNELEYVFFVDGDCRVAPDWLARAQEYLDQHSDVAAVCGRRREQHPEQSVYNRLCDFEWDTPIGEAQSVGGDAVYRCAAYVEAGEFDSTVPAGEEPELCKRLRDRGWKIWRLDTEMTVHDAAMTHYRQWWQRQLRTGYAGLNVERRFQLGVFDRIIKSAYFWGLFVPVATLLLTIGLASFASLWWALGILVSAALIYALQMLRIALRTRTSQGSWRHRLEYGFFTLASKLPIALGAMRQIVEAARGKQAQLVEYKTADSLGPQP